MAADSLDDLLIAAGRLLTPRRLERIRSVASARLKGLTVAFDSLHDPHNVSAALRSCEAFGVQNIHLVGSARTVQINKSITKGCERWLTFHWHESPAACADALRKAGYRILLAMPAGDSQPIHEVDFAEGIALVFGNEHAGLSPEFAGLADGCCHVPMRGFVESLNVSVAVAISLAYATRARREAVGSVTDLSPLETDALLRAWLQREFAVRMGWQT